MHIHRQFDTIAIQQIHDGTHQGMRVIGSISNQPIGLPLPLLDLDAVNPENDQLFSTFSVLLTRDDNTRPKLCRAAASNAATSIA